MKQRTAQMIGGATVALSTLALPLLSFAQFSTSTAASSVTDFITDLASVIAAVVVAILGLLAALVGLGWGVRKFLKWVGGRKF